METRRNTIPVHRLGELTDKGYHLERVSVRDQVKDSVALGLHRDDHYIFLIKQKGWTRMLIEFESFVVEENMLVCILPGQVHAYEDIGEDVSGWFLAIDAGFLPDAFRMVLEDPLRKPLLVSDAGLAELTQCLELANALQQRPPSMYDRQAIYALLTSFAAMCTGLIAGCGGAAAEPVSRAQLITRDFRKLVISNYKTLKSPGAYAAALHLSLSYLNEAVKETTGFPVSYWIQQEIILEAKRLLYYNKESSVKEIAHELGYDDHTYFSRMFKKTVGRTPMEFRRSYHR